jgi:fumarate hydratase class II
MSILTEFMMTKTRVERDSMGEMEVPDDALYGATTQRAILNFPISKLRFSKRFIGAIGLVKYCAAKANYELGLLPKELAEPVMRAAKEVEQGLLMTHFPLDIFQTGSGTSTNMNANEVIANRAVELLGAKRGDKELIHPNDHVNMSQSSNDVIPTALHIATYLALQEELLPALALLHESLHTKAVQFSELLKAGRTHLQDATPITLGQEFSGYAAQIQYGIERIRRSQISLAELALGGTAVGTGLNAHPEFAKRAITELTRRSGAPFVEARNHFEAQGARDAAVELSGQLRTIACSLMKIANDIRWLASGPRCGLGEIELPPTQPGSSIMPAKVNPVICESVMMVAAHVIGNDSCITVAGQHGNFELNVMLPVIAHSLLESIELLGSTAHNFSARCVAGIEANKQRCLEFAEKSLATCASLAPRVGYDMAAQIAKRALAEDKTVRQVAREMGVLSDAELAKALDLMAMTKPTP